MLGLYPIGAASIGWVESQLSTPATPADPMPDDVDAYSVPPSRWVVFEGSKRVVVFEGSRRVVVFEGSRRVVRFEGSDNKAGF